MNAAAFLKSIAGRDDALEQLSGALWAETRDPQMSAENRAELVRAKVALEKSRARRRAA